MDKKNPRLKLTPYPIDNSVIVPVYNILILLKCTVKWENYSIELFCEAHYLKKKVF